MNQKAQRETMKKILLFGGSFDPPTKGHVNAITQWMDGFDEVWVVPVFQHPYASKSKTMSSFEDRITMAQLAFNPLEKVRVRDSEFWISAEKGGGSVFTHELIQAFKGDNPYCEFHLLIGSDVLKDIEMGRWTNTSYIREAIAGFCVVQRDEISSTSIRDWIRRGGFVPHAWISEKVQKYILEHKLYPADY